MKYILLVLLLGLCGCASKSEPYLVRSIVFKDGLSAQVIYDNENQIVLMLRNGKSTTGNVLVSSGSGMLYGFYITRTNGD